MQDDQHGEAEEGEDPAHAVTPSDTSYGGELARRAVALEELLEVDERGRRDALEHLGDHLRDPGEREAAVEEGRDRDLVGRVQRAWRRAAGHAGLAGEPQAGEELDVGLLEVEVAGRGEVEPGHRDVRPLGEVQRVGDRHPHVGQAQVGELGAVVELDERVDDRLRVDDDVDAVVADAEQVVGLDQLQALVHQGGRVDRDPAPHLPGGVREGLGRGDAIEVVTTAERPAGGGQHEPLHRRGALGPQELEQRRVLGVHRQDPGLRRLGKRGDELAADHQALLVGEREVDPLRERDDRRPEPGDADDRVQDEVGLGRGDQLAHALGAGEDPGPLQLRAWRARRRRPRSGRRPRPGGRAPGPRAAPNCRRPTARRARARPSSRRRRAPARRSSRSSRG